MLAAVLLCGHALAMAALYPLALPLVVKIGLALALVESARRGVRNALVFSPLSVGAVTLRQDRTLTLRFIDGKEVDGLADDATTVTPWLVILICRLDAGRSCTVVLARDALGEARHRALRLWLRWCPTARSGHAEGGARRN
ncbi:MAG: hypothetical protein M0P39_08160 [Rhodocyclaceae bacterium]|jgi:hypothetical protein|nr:hypothetical protein [Rhodocyclaceae bacterium]